MSVIAGSEADKLNKIAWYSSAMAAAAPPTSPELCLWADFPVEVGLVCDKCYGEDSQLQGSGSDLME